MFDKIELQGDTSKYPRPEIICKYKQICIRENFTIPCVKPDIEQILDTIAHPFIDECTMIDTPVGKKLVIKGHIEQKVIYVADVPCQSVHAAHFDMPFCEFEDIHSECTWTDCDLSCPQVIIEYLTAHKTGPKQITKCVILFVWWPHKGHLHPCPPPPPPCHPHPYPQPEYCPSHQHPGQKLHPCSSSCDLPQDMVTSYPPDCLPGCKNCKMKSSCNLYKRS